MKKTIWLDCDPGHDDAMAIILAAKHADINLIGVSTVAGNQAVDKTFANARAVLAAIGRTDVPVLRGQATALLHPMPFCEEIHGVSGLDGPDGKPLFAHLPALPDNEMWLYDWKEALVAASIKLGDEIDLVCTASLTNVALLITIFPSIRSYIRITIMGGALGVGNTGPAAEFNIENDPEAAHIVFESGIDLTMVPLEVTHTLLANPEVMKKIGAETPFTKKISELLYFFRDTYKVVFKFDHPPLHDPAAVYYVLNPSAFTSRKMRVDIERGSLLSRGQTVCDVYGRSKLPANCNVALAVDVHAFWEEMITAVHAVKL